MVTLKLLVTGVVPKKNTQAEPTALRSQQELPACKTHVDASTILSPDLWLANEVQRISSTELIQVTAVIVLMLHPPLQTIATSLPINQLSITTIINRSTMKFIQFLNSSQVNSLNRIKKSNSSLQHKPCVIWQVRLIVKVLKER